MKVREREWLQFLTVQQFDIVNELAITQNPAYDEGMLY